MYLVPQTVDTKPGEVLPILHWLFQITEKFDRSNYKKDSNLWQYRKL